MGSKRDKLKRAVRKTVKWGGLVVTVLLLVVWIGSGWWGVVWQSGGAIRTTVGSGVCIVTDDDNMKAMLEQMKGTLVLKRWQVRSAEGPFLWWFRTWNIPGIRVVHIPLWFPALLSLLATAAAWRADSKYLRRARVGMCPACGYDRAGLAAGVMCPECGAAAGGVVSALTDHVSATDNSKAEKR